MKWQKFLGRWLASSRAEAPILMTVNNDRELERVVKRLVNKEKVEVVELKTDKVTISIERIRALIQKLSLTSLKEKRLVIVPQADRLSIPAANALLKSLEESSQSTRWLLASRYPRRLLPTIRSRCQRVTGFDLSAPDSEPVEMNEVERITVDLERQLRTDGPCPELKLAYMRLRDFYHISSQRGNKKMATEVLLASLPAKRKNK